MIIFHYTYSEHIGNRALREVKREMDNHLRKREQMMKHGELTEEQIIEGLRNREKFVPLSLSIFSLIFFLFTKTNIFTFI